VAESILIEAAVLFPAFTFTVRGERFMARRVSLDLRGEKQAASCQSNFCSLQLYFFPLCAILMAGI
jgi:hypothetical protein